MNIEKFEEFISQYPIFEYRLLDTEEIGIEDSKEKNVLYKKEEDLDEDDSKDYFDETESEDDFEDDFDEGDSDINSELFKSFL